MDNDVCTTSTRVETLARHLQAKPQTTCTDLRLRVRQTGSKQPSTTTSAQAPEKIDMETFVYTHPSTATARLSKAQIKHYEEHGYLVVRKLFSEAELAGYADHFRKICSGAGAYRYPWVCPPRYESCQHFWTIQTRLRCLRFVDVRLQVPCNLLQRAKLCAT